MGTTQISFETSAINAIKDLNTQQGLIFSKFCFNDKQGLNLIDWFNGIENDKIHTEETFPPFIISIIRLVQDTDVELLSKELKDTKNGLTALNVIYGIPNK